jgi:hypothetical protein
LRSVKIEVSLSAISNYSKKWASNLGEKLRPTLLIKLTGLFKWHGPKTPTFYGWLVGVVGAF